MYVLQSAFPSDAIRGGFFWCHILNLRFLSNKEQNTPIHCVAFKHIFLESVEIMCDMHVFLCVCASFLNFHSRTWTTSLRVSSKTYTWLNIDSIQSRNSSKHCKYSPEFINLIESDVNCSYSSPLNKMNIPTHLGKGALHIRRPPPRHISSGAPSRRYPKLQENVKVSPMPKLYPFLRPNRGIPGSSHGSRVYSTEDK